MGIIGNLAKNKQTSTVAFRHISDLTAYRCRVRLPKGPKPLSLSLSLRVTTMASDGVPPIIAAQLNYLLSHFPLSVKVTLFIFPFHFLGNQTELKKKKKKKTYILQIHFIPLQIEHLWSGSKFSTGVIDRFTIVIPYCLDFIKCQWDLVPSTTLFSSS